jgi:hypothetical protein
MSNPFLTDNLVPIWAKSNAILKGAEQGHPFRGNQYTKEEQAEYFRSGEPRRIESMPNAGSTAITLPDGMVNVLTGQGGTGKSTSYGFEPTKPHMIVSGQRPDGTTFTRVLTRTGTGAKIGDYIHFQHDQTGRYMGVGTVIGIHDPTTGKVYGVVPNKMLSHHVWK